MLVYRPFALCFVTLRGIFMLFLCFCVFAVNETPQCQFPVSAIFVFQKSYTGNILRIGRNKSHNSYFSQHETKSKEETEGHQRAAAPWHGAVHPLVAP
jgi:hypothetical protein